uniref:Uncharacterized protein n=1 Tax=Podoviridae sp. ctBev14 TaxID=2823556 RepID=A0A8S5LAT3_9CAUD|nr:MAG TPA: hypothetical protein [Podoviridae sp. ctBev14]
MLLSDTYSLLVLYKNQCLSLNQPWFKYTRYSGFGNNVFKLFLWLV